MADKGEDGTLGICVLDLFHAYDLFLFQDFDGIESHVVLASDQMDSAETTSAQSSLNIEIVQGIPAAEFSAIGSELLLLLLKECCCCCVTGISRCGLDWLRERLLLLRLLLRRRGYVHGGIVLWCGMLYWR